MNTELQREKAAHDLELPGACAACDGSITARITPGGARAVCLACRLVSALMVSPADGGVRIVHLPGGVA